MLKSKMSSKDAKNRVFVQKLPDLDKKGGSNYVVISGALDGFGDRGLFFSTLQVLYAMNIFMAQRNG